ncbi:MAG: hypothetical protein M3O22_05060 [Pseudomonadota bacterium]|nr:hypothetical protein [Pseudomonadota bacterium]
MSQPPDKPPVPARPASRPVAAKRQAPLAGGTSGKPGELTPEMRKALRFAGTLYALVALGILLVAITFALRGEVVTTLIVLIPAAIMGAMAWQCLRKLS